MTSNKDYLSQEEIDALLRHASDDSSSSASSSELVDQYLSPLEQDALGEIGNITFGSAATALSTLLGKKVEITTPKVSVVSKNQLQAEFPKPHVAVFVDYVDGFHGTNLLVIQTEDAQVIAELMMGGDGSSPPTELNEIHISAIQEAMNQMMGSSATSMSSIFNRFVNISPPGINILDLTDGNTDDLPEEDYFVKIAFRMVIGELIDSTIMQLLPVTFASDMVSTLMGQSGDAEEASTPAAQSPDVNQAPAAPDRQDTTAAASSYSSQQLPPSQPQQPQPQMGAGQAAAAQNRNVNVQPVQFASFNASQSLAPDQSNLNLLLDIPLRVTVELGRTQKVIKEILDLSQGSIIELDKLAGEPVDILVNGKLIAKGEVVVIDENFGVRVTDIINQWDRIQKLQ